MKPEFRDWKSPALQSFGPTERSPDNPHLNVVMVRHTFTSVAALARYARGLLKRRQFPSSEPHVFLFSESPFPETYFPKRAMVKAQLRALSKALAAHHPDSRVVFSINEQTRRAPRLAEKQRMDYGHSNTGYVVSKEGAAAAPKLFRSDGEFFAAMRLKEDRKSRWGINESLHDESARPGSTRGYWERRADKWRGRRTDFASLSFGTGHEVGYRVCADVVYNPVPQSPRVALVSGYDLPTNMFSRAFRAHHSLVFLNDRMMPGGMFDDHHDFLQRNVVMGSDHLFLDSPLVEHPELFEKLEATLKQQRIRLHLIG